MVTIMNACHDTEDNPEDLHHHVPRALQLVLMKPTEVMLVPFGRQQVLRLKIHWHHRGRSLPIHCLRGRIRSALTLLWQQKVQSDICVSRLVWMAAASML